MDYPEKNPLGIWQTSMRRCPRFDWHFRHEGLWNCPRIQSPLSFF